MNEIMIEMCEKVFSSKKSFSKLQPNQCRVDPHQLYAMLDGVGGMHVTGMNGAGKSVFAQNFVQAALAAGNVCLHVFDPPGPLINKCVKDVLNTKGAIDRTYLIAPGDTRHKQFPLNPLSTPREAWMNDHDYSSRLQCSVGHAAELTLSIFGDGGFDGRPNQYLYTNLILQALGSLGLPMADYEHFFAGSPIHPEFLQCLDDKAQVVFERLEQMDLATQEKLIGSTFVRFESIFSSNVVRSVLGTSDPDKCLDNRRLIQENAICLYDFSTRGSLSTMQRNFLSNLYLSDLIRTVTNMPEEEWAKHLIVVIIDEFPVFANVTATAAMLTEIFPQIRKMNLKFVCLDQGIFCYDGGVDNRLLRTMTSNFTSVVFRHRDVGSCEFFGNLLALPELDPEREKLREFEKEQYQAGEKVVTTVNYSAMTSRGKSWSRGGGGSQSTDISSSQQRATANGASQGTSHSNTHTEGSAESQGTNRSETQSNTRSNADHVRDAFSVPTSKTSGYSSGNATQNGRNESISSNSSDASQEGTSQEKSTTITNGKTDGVSLSSGFNWSYSDGGSETTQESFSYSQSIRPVYAWRTVTRFLELMTLDEQRQLKAQDIAMLETGQCYVYLAGQVPFFLSVPLPHNPFPYDTPYYLEKLDQLTQRINSLTCCELGHVILEERQRIGFPLGFNFLR